MKHDEFVQLEKLNKQYVQLEQKENYELQKVTINSFLLYAAAKVEGADAENGAAVGAAEEAPQSLRVLAFLPAQKEEGLQPV
jgi:hypothetical protein